MSTIRPILLALICTLCSLSAYAETEQSSLIIKLPEEFIVDVTKFGADPSGKKDSSDAIQQALNSIRASDPSKKTSSKENHGKTLYFPKGTYLVSKEITADHEVRGAWGGSETPARHIRIYGEDRFETIIKLKNSTKGFNDPKNPKAIISYLRGRSSNTSFMNSLRNLTLVLGKGNPGAIGVDFHSNNGGGIDHVTIDASDGGFAGIRCDKRLGGISMIYQTEITGAAYGAYFAHGHVGYALQTVKFTGQKGANIYTADKPLWIFDSEFESKGQFIQIVPYEGGKESGIQVIVDGCSAKGSHRYAISTFPGANLYVRNTKLKG